MHTHVIEVVIFPDSWNSKDFRSGEVAMTSRTYSSIHILGNADSEIRTLDKARKVIRIGNNGYVASQGQTPEKFGTRQPVLHNHWNWKIQVGAKNQLIIESRHSCKYWDKKPINSKKVSGPFWSHSQFSPIQIHHNSFLFQHQLTTETGPTVGLYQTSLFLNLIYATIWMVCTMAGFHYKHMAQTMHCANRCI